MLTWFLCWTVILGSVASIPLEGNSDSQRFANYLRSKGREAEGDWLEDAHLNTLQLIEKYGYTAEEHKIQTADGYILSVHRMYNKTCTGEMKAVILQHGLLSSSIDWIIMGPGKGLGYILADTCMDVWLGNSRGNTYSKDHVSLATDSAEFWDFSWHEMGVNDLPTLIDYVLARTGRDTLYYIGHSQGTTQYFIMDSLKPEYAKKVAVMFALAPIAFMGYSESKLLTTVANFQGILGWLAENLGINQFFPTPDFLAGVGGSLCNDEHPNAQNVCANVIYILCGYDEAQTNKTMLPVILGHTPASSSTKQMLHYAQQMNNPGKFSMFDYGKSENQDRYGQKTPPEYPLENSKSTIALIYSKNDLLANVKDVDILDSKLLHNLGKFLVPYDAFNHLDYMWAIDAKELVYDLVLDIMSRY